MRLIALCGAAAAGKDTVADMLPARKLAFADTLYDEVAEAWGVEQHVLRCRETKEIKSWLLRVEACDDAVFRRFATSRFFDRPCENDTEQIKTAARSARQILQLWGDYRRDQNPGYFVWRVARELLEETDDVVITDVRFPNEAAMVRQLGGQIWQIRRPGYEAGGTGHASDNDGSQFNPDRIIYNNGALEELRETVLKEWNQ